MNSSVFKVYAILLFCFFNISVGMEQLKKTPKKTKMSCRFLEAPREIQRKIIAPLQPNDKNSLQKTCKYFKNIASAHNSETFHLAQDPFFCAHKKDISRIILTAAYMKNYHLVEDILKKNDDLAQYHWYSFSIFEKNFLFDLHSIAEHNTDKNLFSLIEKYYCCRICSNPSMNTEIAPSKISDPLFLPMSSFKRFNVDALAMTCCFGDSCALHKIISDNQITMSDVNKVMSCFFMCLENNNSNCMKVLCENICFDEELKGFCGDFFLRNLLREKHKSIFEAIILSRCFNLNRVNTYQTILDFVAEKARKDKKLKFHVQLLKKNGGMTAKELSGKEEKCTVQ